MSFDGLSLSSWGKTDRYGHIGGLSYSSIGKAPKVLSLRISIPLGIILEIESTVSREMIISSTVLREIIISSIVTREIIIPSTLG